jgi:hypothetical protein
MLSPAAVVDHCAASARLAPGLFAGSTRSVHPISWWSPKPSGASRVYAREGAGRQLAVVEPPDGTVALTAVGASLSLEAIHEGSGR